MRQVRRAVLSRGGVGPEGRLQRSPTEGGLRETGRTSGRWPTSSGPRWSEPSVIAAADDPGRLGRGRGRASISWYAFALKYLETRWGQAAAKTRSEINETLSAITRGQPRGARGRPNDELLRRALGDWAFVMPRPDARTEPAETRLALDWGARALRPLGDLLHPVVMRSVLQALRVQRDGTVAAAETQRRRRMTIVNAVRQAIERGKLPADPCPTRAGGSPRDRQAGTPGGRQPRTGARNLLYAVSWVGGYRRVPAGQTVGTRSIAALLDEYG